MDDEIEVIKLCQGAVHVLVEVTHKVDIHRQSDNPLNLFNQLSVAPNVVCFKLSTLIQQPHKYLALHITVLKKAEDETS